MSFVEPVGFKLNSRVRAKLDSFDEYPFHMHEDIIEIICVLKGEVQVSESAQDYSLASGDVHIFNPKEPHKIWGGGKDSILISIHIDQNYYADIFNLEIFPYFICNSLLKDAKYTIDIKYLRFLIARILTEYINTPTSDIIIEKYTRDLLDYLLDQHRDYKFLKTGPGQIKMVKRPNAELEGRDVKKIYEIIDYIYANFTNKITLEEIANEQYLSLGYLSRYIKKESGLTFSENVSLARCEEVERLLGNTNKTIDQIAMDVGFANRNHLAMHFKKWFKKTPSEYRMSINADIAKMTKIDYRTVRYDDVKDEIEGFLDGR